LVHPALLYTDDTGYLAATVGFVRTGLQRREPVLVAVPTPKLTLLKRELGGLVDRVTFLDMAVSGRNPNRIIPWVLRAFADEHTGRRIRVIGEPIWPGRSAVEVTLGIQHEALINSAFAGRAATILCPYDVRGLDAAILGYAARTHPVIDQDGVRRRSTAYTDPDRVVAMLNQPLPEPTGPTVDLIFDVPGLRGVRLLVGEHASRAGLDGDRIAGLQVAVNEIATNTLVHGGGPGTLRVSQEPDRVLCDIRGPGEITDWLAGRVRPTDHSTSGRGILLANRLCDLVQTYSGPTGTTTRLHMLLD
jgi:anti-sigma regulatory factor (Ser/Thr protein kinase)